MCMLLMGCGSGGGFNPLSLLTDCIWLDAGTNVFFERTGDSASTVSTNGTLVGTWRDRNLGLNFTAESDGARPTLVTNAKNGKPVVRFGGSHWLSILNSDFLRNKPGATVVIATKINTLTGSGSTRFLNIQTATESTRFDLTEGSPSQFSSGYRRLDGDSSSFIVAASDTNWNIVTGLLDWLNGGASGHILLKNGAVAGSATVSGTGNCSDTASPRINIGAFKSSTLELPLRGDIAEILVAPRRLSDDEFRSVEEYFADKYDIPIASV